ncbi:hypothetical protein EWB00_001307 [Schistosoma japonicum]|uniref:Ribosome biogenesis protein NOP53 n=1 Tax=Schistosoma japonicum TaxID=6182 RepID=A0A4Z2DGZ1_SCHJA|nr:hypothetical protein EWB00_001307 [Schistosoma japonicum]
MKHLGKNKKKRWQYCYKDIDAKLQDASQHKRIINEGFTEVTTLNKRSCIVKGDKNSAKLFQDIPSVNDERLHISRPKRNKKKVLEVDIWEDLPVELLSSSKASTSRKTAGKNADTLPLPCAGAIESAKQKRELKTERFIRSLKGATLAPNPLKDMKNFLYSLNAESNIVEDTENVSEVLPKKKPRKINVHKKMRNDLENLPKLLKEIKREKKTREKTKSAVKAKNEIRDKLKKADLNIPFQLPHEISSSLRKLCPEVYLSHEIERRRNWCPRARKSLGCKRKGTSFERNRQTNTSL